MLSDARALAKAHIQNFYQSSVPLYYTVRRFVDRPQYPVDEHTDICVEAYPSSANSFVYVLLKEYLAPGKTYAHHTHALASLKVALKRDIQRVFIVRQPEGALSSRLTRWDVPLTPSLQQYIRLHRFVLEHSSEFLLIDFEELRTDLPSIVEKLSRHIGVVPELEAGDIERIKAEIFEHIDDHYERSDALERSASPNIDRSEQKAKIVGDILEHELFAEAESLYQRLRVVAVSKPKPPQKAAVGESA